MDILTLLAICCVLSSISFGLIIGLMLSYWL